MHMKGQQSFALVAWPLYERLFDAVQVVEQAIDFPNVAAKKRDVLREGDVGEPFDKLCHRQFG